MVPLTKPNSGILSDNEYTTVMLKSKDTSVQASLSVAGL